MHASSPFQLQSLALVGLAAIAVAMIGAAVLVWINRRKTPPGA